MCESIVDIESPTAEIRRGKKTKRRRRRRRRRRNHRENIMACPIIQGGHNERGFKNTVYMSEDVNGVAVNATQ